MIKRPVVGTPHRSDVNVRRDKSVFRYTAGKSHNVNNLGLPMRGGIRL